MILEKEKDLDNEKSAQKTILLSTGWRLIKLPKRYTVDWARIDDNEVVNGWVEYKHRSHVKGTYPDLMISCGKLVEGFKLSAITQLPFFLIVSFKVDSISGDYTEATRDYYVCEITRNVLKNDVRMGGRLDRGYGFDIEPVYHLPYMLFSKININYLDRVDSN